MPVLGLAFTRASLDFLKTVPPKVRSQIKNKAEALAVDPHPNGAKPLKGVIGKDGERIYRERSGDYRILYLVRDNPGEVIILDIGHRKNVYR